MSNKYTKLKSAFANDPEMLRKIEHNEMMDVMKKKSAQEIKAEYIKGDKGDDGEPGKTPIKGEDYFTDAEIEAVAEYIKNIVKDEVTPVKGVDYFDGEDAEPVDVNAIIKEVLKRTPTELDILAKIKIPEPEKIDKRAIMTEIISAIPKPIIPTIQQIVDEIKTKRLIELRDIKGARLDMNDQRWHGGGLSNITGLISAGTNVTLSGSGTRTDPYVINSTGSGGGGVWGTITGTLSDQTDLQNALNAKQNTITTGTTAQYLRGDLSLATFPTALSSFTNDLGNYGGFLTSIAGQDLSTASNTTSKFIKLTSLSAGTGISYDNTTGVITNSLPDQTVSITAGTNITSVTGTYPNFTINAATQSGTYVLPTASASVLGGIKVGSGLSIDGSGVLTATGGGGTWTDSSTNTGTNKTLNSLTNYIEADATHQKVFLNLGRAGVVGDAVYVTNWNGANNCVEVGLARANSTSTLPCAGVLETAGADGTVQSMRVEGILMNVNTNAWSTGTRLYVSATTAGTLTSTRPTTPNFDQAVATVSFQNATTGILDVIRTAYVGTMAYADTASYALLSGATFTGNISALNLSGTNTGDNAATTRISGTIDEIAYFDTTGSVKSLTTATYPSKTELSYVKGVTSGIQAQINAKGAGTVTSVAALTLGTTGTDLSSSVATGTTTPVITLNVPTASASNRGVLSSTDWITFNNKGNGTWTDSSTSTGSNKTFIAPVLGNATGTSLALGTTHDANTVFDLKTLNASTNKGLRMENDNVNNIPFSTFVSGDAQLRFLFSSTGGMEWGGGTAGTDISLYRSSAGNLTVGGSTGILNATNFKGLFNGAYIFGDSNNENLSVGGTMSLLSSGSANTLIGENANGGFLISSGSNNTGVGDSALFSISTGSNNTAIGTASLLNISTTSNNIGLGFSAGRYETGTAAFYVDAFDRSNTANEKTGAILYGVMSATASSQTLKTNSAFTATYGINIPTGQTYKINNVALRQTDITSGTIASGSTATTQATTTNNTTLATTAFVKLASQPAYLTFTTLTPGATVTWTPVIGTNVYTLVPAQTETLNMGIIPAQMVGQKIQLVITTSGTTSYTITFGTNIRYSASTLATGTVTAKKFVLEYLIESASSMLELSRTVAL